MQGYSDQSAPPEALCWIEINLDAIKDNALSIKSLLAPTTKLMAVVKANAYGLGAVPVAQALNGIADMLAVTTIEEGIELRESGIKTPILVFLPANESNASSIMENQLIATVDTLHSAAALAKAAEKYQKIAPCHLKLNTGMNRLGSRGSKAYDLVNFIHQNEHLSLAGIYSHLAKANCKFKVPAFEQIKEFRKFVENLDENQIERGLAHICNSAATISLPHAHFDMVRCGTLLYGQSSVPLPENIQLKDPWSPRCRIVAQQIVAKGQKIGYGGDYQVNRPIRIGILPIGYYQGFGMEPPSRNNFLGISKQCLIKFARCLMRKPLNYAYWQGGKLPIIGRISMQMTMVDISKKPLEVGDILGMTLRKTCANPCIQRIYLSETSPVAGVLSEK